MKGLSLLGVMAGLMVALTAGIALAAHTSPGTVHVDVNNTNCPGNGTSGDPFCTIQSGVDHAAPGDTVQVAAGTYVEEVTVDKSLTLEGAGSGSDATSNTVLSGSGSGTGLTVDASDVTIRDLQITGYGVGIDLNSTMSTLTFSNVASIANHVRAMSIGGNADLTGVTLNAVDFSDSIGDGSDGIRASTTSTVDGLTITDSHFDDNGDPFGSNAGSGIEVYQHGLTPGAFTNVTITNTTFNGNAAKGMYVEKLSNASLENLAIANSGTDGDYPFNNGIDLNLKFKAYDNIEILNSTFENSGVHTTDHNGLDFAAALAIKARGQGVDSPTYTSKAATLSNVLVEGNKFSFASPGSDATSVRVGEPGADAGPEDVTLRSNVLSDGSNIQVENEVDGGLIIDASGNWWGITSDSTIDGLTTGGVDFTPFLDTGNDGDTGTPGFQGDFSTLNVTTLGEQTGSVGRIQEGVDLVDGSTVNVAAGTYEDNVEIETSGITLEGAGSNSTVIAPSSGRAVAVSSHTEGLIDGVTVRGFTLEPGDGDFAFLALSGTKAEPDTTDLTLDDIQVANTTLAIGLNDVDGATLSNIVLSNITLPPDVGAMELTGVSDLDILDSRFEDNTRAIRLQDTDGLPGQPDAYGTNGAVAVHNSCFTGNDDGVVNGDTNVSPDATDNWWGAANGPNGAGPGDGDSVSANVAFDPWLTAEYTGATIFLANDIVVLETTVTDSDGTPIQGDTVEFFVNGTSEGTAMTDANGVASINIGVQPVNVYEVAVETESAAGCTVAEAMIVVSEDGFVSGGGWIDSPAGAYNGVSGTVRVDANPDDAWIFNAEPPYVTPADFSGEEASIGNGSIHVEPITNAAGADAKFILRHVPDSEILVEDFESFSIDFLIDDDDSSQVNQFYVNFYTLTPDPNDGSWYDCRFDYIANTGSTSTWTALSFSDDDPADAKGDNIGGTCPASPSAMPVGSTVLFISVNLGDTGLNDTGVGGYYDNVQMTVGGSTTTWDFEEPLTGKANFGFVSKYKKGANVPTGNTQFVFKAADLKFHSTEYEWLVVTGNDTAKFKGEGTINGEMESPGNPYKFQVWAGDGEPDTFTIKIWYEDGGETVVYENDMDQPIEGGSIKVHQPKK